MIRLALLTPNAAAAEAVEQMVQDSSVFELVYRGSLVSSVQAELRTLSSADAEVILLDIGDWQSAAPFVSQINLTTRRGALVGFREDWTSEEQERFLEAGVVELLHEPFSVLDMERAAYRAIHQRQPVTHSNTLAFLPSKAGGGCSTVALNTAATLANDLNQRTLLIEADRRSGVLSILLGVEGKEGLAEVLARPDNLTGMDWSQHLVTIGKLDLLLANPFNPGPLPNWVNFYRLLRFVEKRYDFIIVDLPEIVNPATVELLSAARYIFIVCEPEVTSLKLVPLRRTELEARGVSRDKIFILGNRWEAHRTKKEDVAGTAEIPIFATLPNDYIQVKDAVLESRLVSRESAFGSGCLALARKLADVPAPEPASPVSSLLRRFIKT